MPCGRAGNGRRGRADGLEEEIIMARKASGPRVDRRAFLRGVVAAGAASALTSPARAAEPPPAPRAPSALRPARRVAAAETGPPRELARVPGIPGSDFMIDVIKTLDVKYCPSNCASSY